jgi:hypothetical protein
MNMTPRPGLDKYTYNDPSRISSVLEIFTGSAPTQQGEGLDPSLLETIEVGSCKLNKHSTPAVCETVTDARRKFYGRVLGWDDESHVCNKSYKKFLAKHTHLIPINTFIDAQMELASHGIDGKSTFSRSYIMINQTADSIREHISNFSKYELDSARIMNACPPILCLTSDNIDHKWKNLENAGLDPADVVSRHPKTLYLSSDTVTSKLAAFKNLGFDEVRLVSTYPPILSRSVDAISMKLSLLQEYDAIEHVGDLNSLDERQIGNFCSLPIDSLIAYLTAVEPEPAIVMASLRIARSSLHGRKIRNQQERKSYLISKITKVYNTLGKHAVDYIGNMPSN